MPRPQRIKLCEKCQQADITLYRVQWDETRQFVFVCPACWQEISLDNPWYVYGGTWKARKRH